jgi:hypothetical protein
MQEINMAKLPGESMRDSIAQLLRMKYQHVETEKRLKTTTADVYYIDDTVQLFSRPIAIESKDWSDRLSSGNIADIYNLYAPSLLTREIDFLWIIGKHPLSSSPKASLDSLNNVRYSTFDEFRASLMNFKALLDNNYFSFDHHDASKNFVEARVRNTNQKLLDYVYDWLDSPQSGLMIYGGYGLGKTTFSLYIASVLSQKYTAHDFYRIPIRISLGGLYSKQDLTGLICSALSGGDGSSVVKDFSYGMFVEMNRNGQYLLILDGFDEMRHAMDFDDFVYTFEQMKPLFSGSAKVIILGRPDSFLSNQEEDEVLNALFEGRSDLKKQMASVDLAFFTKEEVLTYLNTYIRARDVPLSPEQANNYHELMARLPDSEDHILMRPIQLNMFTKIMDDVLSSQVTINKYELYRRFIYRFISRETRKPARRPTKGAPTSEEINADRAAFMQAMAWWILNTKKENRFLPEEIPVQLIPRTIRLNRSHETAIREALVGSVIEPVSAAGVLGRKAKKYYYFPHKSYVEFLVTNYFQNAMFSVEIYREFIRNINNEILEFLEEGPPAGIEQLRRGLLHSIGTIDPRLIEVSAKDKKVRLEINSRKTDSRPASHIYTHYFYLKENSVDPKQYLLARIKDSSTLDSFLATLNCASSELSVSGDIELAAAIALNCITSISIHNIVGVVIKGHPIRLFHADSEVFRAKIAADSIQIHGERREFVLSLDRIDAAVANGSRSSLFVSIPVQQKHYDKIPLPYEFIRKVAPREWLEPLNGLLSRYASDVGRIPIQLFGNAADRFG